MHYGLCRHANLASLPARVVVIHNADVMELIYAGSVGTMHECRPGDLLTWAAVMHHGDKAQFALKQYAGLKGLEANLSCVLSSIIQHEMRPLHRSEMCS